ncbi:hypothetical protein A9F13_06g01023 [Clavispora lusitaniae]|uniref:DNA replication regulator Sld3 C-terminal domain-containing protein n=1 Tax=Clavispora lusitaniae TaxID=36911 RepID=A0AA91T248_CLALS|nr:hypothetical protein A9F13_06g01023 [Clavispora lusitaniae]
MENGISSTDENKFPFHFSLASGTSNTTSLEITVLAPIPGLHIHHLNTTAVANKRLVILQPEITRHLSDENSFHVKQTGTNGLSSFGYLLRCGLLCDAYQLLDAPANPPSQAFENEEECYPIADSTEKTLGLWQTVQDVPLSPKLVQLSMKPPTLAVPQSSKKTNYTLSPTQDTDPLNFLLSRYFNTLYSFTTPLSYFPKTALSRFKNLCNNDAAVRKEKLLSIYLTTEQLELRYSNNYGLDGSKSESAPISIYEQQSREFFMKNHIAGSTKEDIIRKVVLELKTREAQLQILILMELILCWGKDETSFLIDNAKVQEKKAKKIRKPSLVRRKKGNKKIIPTFLGVGIQDSSTDTQSSTRGEVNEFTLYTSLIALVDQMSIWDTLLGRTKGEKDESMYGFLAYVLVPYYNKQTPEIVNFIIQKVKESRPKLHVPKSRSRSSRSESHSKEKKAGQQEMQEPEVLSKRTSKFSKTLLSANKVPFLHRSVTDVPTGLQPAFSLKRSKSNLGSKNLKRRQVDMSLVRSESQDAEEAKKSKSFLFGDARKIKSVPADPTPHSLVQVEATPARKSLPRHQSASSYPQIMETPSTNRIKELPHVPETPHHMHEESFTVPQKQKLSVNEMFAQLAPPENFDCITSSPVRGGDSCFPPSERRKSLVNSSSQNVHVKEVGSFAANTLSTLHSPFAGSINGSPPPKRKQAYKLGSSTKRTNASMASNTTESILFSGESLVSEISEKTIPMEHSDTVKDTIVESPMNGDTEQVSEGEEEFEDDSGSDSDLEKLLAFSSRPSLRTYRKR